VEVRNEKEKIIRKKETGKIERKEKEKETKNKIGRRKEVMQR
jgi:hypothetical protein